MKFQRKENKS